MLSEVNFVHGAPHVGNDPFSLGASPPGCAQSEHDVYPPAHFEWYQDLVDQAGGAVQRALIATTYAKKLAAKSAALGNVALRQLGAINAGAASSGRIALGGRASLGGGSVRTAADYLEAANQSAKDNLLTSNGTGNVLGSGAAVDPGDEALVPWSGSAWHEKERLSQHTGLPLEQRDYNDVAAEAGRKEEKQLRLNGEGTNVNRNGMESEITGQEFVPTLRADEYKDAAPIEVQSHRTQELGFTDTNQTVDATMPHGFNLLVFLGLA
ncbi:unnamed protein product [Amoebophrya sp. A25]|nr:unnamed protein product [Amoebophrya sp. A25]|eukprot:GSA25T00010408001.1